MQSVFFDDLPEQRKPTGSIGLMRTALPVWSKHKSEFIADYIKRFQFVTKSGVIIDGFSGPQDSDHRDEVWTAKRLLELQPPWIQRFFLCDLDPAQCQALRDLRAAQPQIKGRHISVFEGDFNQRLPDILAANRIRRNTPAFALLDMRTFECSWDSVEKLARHKPEMKIELLYFLATGWIGRAASKKDETELTRWWGNDGWRDSVTTNNVQLAVRVCDRFQFELGYKSARAFPIFRDDHSRRVYYWLIHATDHPQAPELMEAAYRKACGTRLPPSMDVGNDLFIGTGQRLDHNWGKSHPPNEPAQDLPKQ